MTWASPNGRIQAISTKLHMLSSSSPLPAQLAGRNLVDEVTRSNVWLDFPAYWLAGI